MKLLACAFGLAALFLAATALPVGNPPATASEAAQPQTAAAQATNQNIEVLPEDEPVATLSEDAGSNHLPVEKRHAAMEKREDSESDDPQAQPLEPQPAQEQEQEQAQEQDQQPQQTKPAQAPSQAETDNEQTNEETGYGDEQMSDRDMLDLLEYFNHDAVSSQSNDQDENGAQFEEESASESRKKRSVSESGMSAMAAAERKKRSIEEMPVERKKRSLDGDSETAAERLLEQVRLLEMREALRRRLEEEYVNEDESSSAEDSSDEDAEMQKRSEYEERPHSMLLRVAGEPGLFVPLDALRSNDEEEEESSSAESSEEDVPMTKRGYDADNYDDDESGESDELDESEEDERKRELMRELIQAKLREQELNALKRSEVEDSSSESSEDYDETELRKRAYAEDEEDDDDSDSDSDENTELRRELIREYMVLDSLARALAANRQE